MEIMKGLYVNIWLATSFTELIKVIVMTNWFCLKFIKDMGKYTLLPSHLGVGHGHPILLFFFLNIFLEK